MTRTVDIGRAYVTLSENQTKFFDKAISWEVESPYRKGTGFGIKLWNRALVVGWWSKGQKVDHDDHGVGEAMAAVHAYELDTSAEEINTW